MMGGLFGNMAAGATGGCGEPNMAALAGMFASMGMGVYHAVKCFQTHDIRNGKVFI